MSYMDLTDVGRGLFKEAVIEILSSGVVPLVFEKVDGTERRGNATLNSDIIVEAIGRPTEAKPDAKPRKENPDVVRFLDVEKGEFRTFKLEKLISLADLTHNDIFVGVHEMVHGVV